MRFLLIVASIVLSMSLLAEGRQRRKPKLGEDQGILECKGSGSRRFVEFGYGELREAAVYEKDGVTLVQKTTQLGQEGLKLKVDNEYMVKVKFISKKFSSFGSYPKYMGIKLSENYTAANENTKQAYKAIFKEDLIGFHHCSESLRGARGKNSDGCNWLTEEYKGMCPFSNEEDTEVEIVFPFQVPKLPDAVSTTKFRIIGTEEQVKGANGCERLLNPSFPDRIETTSDKDMICFQYNSIFTRR